MQPKYQYEFVLQPHNGHLNLTLQKDKRANNRVVVETTIAAEKDKLPNVTLHQEQYRNLLRAGAQLDSIVVHFAPLFCLIWHCFTSSEFYA